MSRKRKPAVTAVGDDEYAAAREMAAMKCEPAEVDWDALTAENWAKRSHEMGMLNRMLQLVLSKGDEELTAMLAEGAKATSTRCRASPSPSAPTPSTCARGRRASRPGLSGCWWRRIGSCTGSTATATRCRRTLDPPLPG